MELLGHPIVRTLCWALMLLFGWWTAQQSYIPHFGLVWGTVMGMGTVFLPVALQQLHNYQNRPSVTLDLRLPPETAEDQFAELHNTFTERFASSSAGRFDGSDTDGTTFWFYFHGDDIPAIKAAALPALSDCHYLPGSSIETARTRWEPPRAKPAQSPTTR